MAEGVTDADRRRVIRKLERRAAHGRLSEPELNDRIQRAKRALTHAGLDGILLDLPPGPEPAPAPPADVTPPTRPAPTRAQGPWRMPSPGPPPVAPSRVRPWWRRPAVTLMVVAAYWVVVLVSDALAPDPDEPAGSQVPVPATTTPRPPLPLPATTDRVVPLPASTVPSEEPLILRVGVDIEPGLDLVGGQRFSPTSGCGAWVVDR